MSKVPKTLMPQGEDFQARHALSLTLHAPTPVAHRNYVAMVPFVMMHVAAACAPLFGVDWLEALPAKRRFPLVMQRLMMGGVLEAVVEDGDVAKAREAASVIMGAFVVDD